MNRFFVKIFQNNLFWPISLLIIILFLFRWYPERVIGELPIGYDVTTSYIRAIVDIKNGVNYFSSSTLISNIISAKSFLMYAIFQLLLPLFGGNIFLMLKFCGIALYILVGLSFFKMFRKITGYGAKETFYATLLFSTSLATLNLSWTLFRNELGLIFLFLMVSSLMDLTERFTFSSLLLSIFYLFFIFISHEIVFLLAIFFIAIFIIYTIIIKTNDNVISNLLLLIFLIILFLLPAFINIEKGALGLFINPENPEIVAKDAIIYYILLYSTLLIFAVIGLFNNLYKQTKYSYLLFLWLIFSIFVAIEPTIYKTHSLYLWDRWVLLMGIPVCILAYDGIKVLSETRIFKSIGQEAAIIILIVLINNPSFSFAFNKYGIDKDIPNTVAMPQTLIWNSVGQMNKQNSDMAINYLSTIKPPYILISDNRNSGLLYLESAKLYKAEIIYTYGPTSKLVMSKLYDSAIKDNKEIYIFGANELLKKVNNEAVFRTNDGLVIQKIKLDEMNMDEFDNEY